MLGYQAATVTTCDNRADFCVCPCCGYSAAGEPFGACPCRSFRDGRAVDYFTILSLILLLTLEPPPCRSSVQLREPKTAERLGEDVRELPTSFDELDDDLSSIDTVPEEAELDVDMLAPVMENRILREGEGGLVIHHQCWWVNFSIGQLT